MLPSITNGIEISTMVTVCKHERLQTWILMEWLQNYAMIPIEMQEINVRVHIMNTMIEHRRLPWIVCERQGFLRFVSA